MKNKFATAPANVYITHVKQIHVVPSLRKKLETLDEKNVNILNKWPLFEEIAYSQFMVVKAIISRPNYIVLQEGFTENYNRAQRESTFEELSIFAREIFTNGFPASFEELSTLQKYFLVLHQGSVVAYLLGIIDNIYKSADSKRQKEYVYKLIWDKNHFFVFKPREIDALNFAKSFAIETNNPNILLIYGAHHNFEKRIKLNNDPTLIFKEIIETTINPIDNESVNKDYYTNNDIDPYDGERLITYIRANWYSHFKHYLDHAIQYERDLTLVVDKEAERNILHWAVSLGHFDIVQLCLEKLGTLLLDCKSKDGSTPLHFAVSSRHQRIVELLLAHGADNSIVNKDGKTPSQLAEFNKFDEITNIFVSQKKHHHNTSLAEAVVTICNGSQ